MSTFIEQAKTLANQNAIAPKRAKALFLDTLQGSSQVDSLDVQRLVTAIKTGKLALRPYTVSVIERLTGQTKPKVFDTSRQRVIGLRSVHNARLPEGHFYVPYTMNLKVATVTAAVPGAPTQAEILNTDFVGIHTDPNLQNGLITIGVDGERLVSDLSCDVFDSRGLTNVRTGDFELDASILIVGQKEIKGEIDLEGAVAGIGADVYFKFCMYGFAAIHV